VKLGKQSGTLEVEGLRNTYRDVPLNATARKILEEYLPTLPPETVLLFPSRKRAAALSERALGSIVKKYADEAPLAAVSPHDVRHRFGYRLAEGVPLPRLAHIMGHDSLDTTRISVQGTRTGWTARSGDHRMGITQKTSQKARRSDGILGE
jgi:integrase/recombinase XerD